MWLLEDLEGGYLDDHNTVLLAAWVSKHLCVELHVLLSQVTNLFGVSLWKLPYCLYFLKKWNLLFSAGQTQGGFMYINYVDIMHLKCFRKDVAEKQLDGSVGLGLSVSWSPRFWDVKFQAVQDPDSLLASTSWGCNKGGQSSHGVSLLPEVIVFLHVMNQQRKGIEQKGFRENGLC